MTTKIAKSRKMMVNIDVDLYEIREQIAEYLGEG